MAKFEINGYDSYSGCDIVVTAKLNVLHETKKAMKEKVYTLGSLQTLSISTHQDKKPVRVIGSVNALDYTMGQRTIAGSLVFAVFDQHFATEMFNDLEELTGRTFFLPDELPALDITVTFANEYGRQSRMAIYGVRIINEGQVMSINDLYTENTYQFVATAMEPLKKGITSGGNSSNSRSLHVSSSFDNDNIKPISQGEDIYKRSIVESSYSLSRISLIATVEQPIYSEQEGIVKLYLSPIQSTGIISILDKKKNKIILDIQVLSNTSQYVTYLKAGDYSAWYHNDGQILSNTADFIINNVVNFNYSYDDTPIIENVTNNSITALSNNPSHTIGVCKNVETGEEYESEINSRIFKFNNLKELTLYNIYTKSDYTISKSINVSTLESENQILNIFKEYVKYNKNLLSKDFLAYKAILDELKDDNFVYTLTKMKTEEAKELIFMAIKYQNEFIKIINNSNEDMPVKNIENIYGNTFKFNTGITKANVFISKNKKNYFEYSESYPTEITYEGKPNSLYNVVSINDNFVKSPKYFFYSYADNDKSYIEKQFGDANVLNNLDIKYLTNIKLSNNALKCLSAKENKDKDINLLEAPTGYIDESCNLIINYDYKDILGISDNKYYLCISRLEECLDKTPFRKIELSMQHDYTSTIINNVLTAINKNDIFTLWIEDEQFNIISDLGFTSFTDETNDLNIYIIKSKIESIIKNIETNINKSGYLSDIIASIDYENLDIKDIFKEIALLFLSLKEDYAFNLIYELFNIKFSNICINKEKYKTVTYDLNNKVITFDNDNVQLIHIAMKKDNYFVEVINSNSTLLNINYDYNLFYLINANNPVIKSGFVLISNSQYKTYGINLEVI